MTLSAEVPAATPLRIVLRPIGSPATVALSGLGIASLVESGLVLGWVAPGQARDVGLILLAVPFVLQIVACVLLYLARDGTTAACTGVLATTWLAIGLVHIASGSAARDGAIGLLLLGAACALLLSGGAGAVRGLLPAGIFVLAGLRFATAGIYDLGGAHAWTHAGAIIGLVVTGACAYAVLAFDLKGERRRVVLPTLGTGGPDPAVQPLAADLDGVASEPGVARGA